MLRAISMAGALWIGAAAARADPINLSPCALPDLKQVAPVPVRLPWRRIRSNCGGDSRFIFALSSRLLPVRAMSDPANCRSLGGPGEDAISALSLYAQQFASLLENRDLLLVDQRGTGQSAPLHCDLYSAEQPSASLRNVFPLAAVKQCERNLSKGSDLTQYGYLRFASDLEQVRLALGYGRLNIFAGSYGSRAAVVYLRGFPASVRTAYLGSVVQVDVAQPLPMATRRGGNDRKGPCRVRGG